MALSRGQGGTEYLVVMSVVLGIALICIALLIWPVETTKDAKKQQTDIHFKIGEIGTQVEDESYQSILQGLVAYYKFEEGSGTTAADNRGGNTGTIYNGPSWVTGKSGTALDFDGTGGSGGSGSCALFDVPNITDSITIMFWYKPKTVSTTAAIVEKGTGGCSYPYEVYRSNAAIVLRIRNASGCEDLSSGTVLSADNWHHITTTYDGNYKRIYINGTEKSSAAKTGTMITNAYKLGLASTVSAAGACSGWYDNATMDEVMIYNRALSQSEILLLYENPGYPQ